MDSNLITHKGRHRDGVRGIQENPQGTDRACVCVFGNLENAKSELTGGAGRAKCGLTSPSEGL
eukprot:1180166-Prorocentrum_minimum.AAC.1